MKGKVKSFSRVRLSATPRTAAHQAPTSLGFSRQEYWSRVPSPSLIIRESIRRELASLVAQVEKNLPANAGDARDMGSITGLDRSAKVGSGNPLWYSFLESPMDRGAWWATVHVAAKSKTRLGN